MSTMSTTVPIFDSPTGQGIGRGGEGETRKKIQIRKYREGYREEMDLKVLKCQPGTVELKIYEKYDLLFMVTEGQYYTERSGM